MFELDEVEIELSLGIKKSANGAINIVVINIGDEVSAKFMHKVKLELKSMQSKERKIGNSTDFPKEPEKIKQFYAIGAINFSI